MTAEVGHSTHDCCCHSIRNSVGAAWELDDDGAIEFAKAFYEMLLPEGDGIGGTIGQALQSVRALLKQDEQRYGALWAAHEHYGDPNERLAPGGSSGVGPGAGRERKHRRGGR